MQSAEVVLSMLGQKSIQNSEFVFDRLYRNLFNPDFYRLAYSSISAKEGIMTRGGEEHGTDDYLAQTAEEIIAALKGETYYPRQARALEIPTRNDRLRSSRDPSFQAILVQEVMRLLLQAIYEPLFKNTSHGFRPGRSCQTALVQLKTTCKGTNWVIKGDIEGSTGMVEHARLLKILSRKMSDGRFLNLINRFLKAGYMEFQAIHSSSNEMPQGATIGSQLANIYLHELDVFMEHLCAQLSTHGVPPQGYQLFQEPAITRFAVRKTGAEEQTRQSLPQRSTIPAPDTPDVQAVKVRYLRYMGDFLVMITGNQGLAGQISKAVRDFLQQELALALQAEQTLIIHLTSQHVRFLGYELARTRNTFLRGNKRAISETIQLLVPGEVIQERLQPFVKNGQAIHHNARINLPLSELLLQYNAEIQALYDYYCLATDVHTRLGKFRYYHYYSLLKTVARKEKCSIAQILNKYGVDVKLKQKTGTRKIFGISTQTQEGPQTLTYFHASLKKVDASQGGREIPGPSASVPLSSGQTRIEHAVGNLDAI